MSVEPIQEVIKHWERSEITVEQCLGKILLLVLQMHQRLATLEANARRRESHLGRTKAAKNQENPNR